MNRLVGVRKLILLDEFKRSIPTDINVNTEERQIESPEKVALLAFEFSLTHKNFESKTVYFKD